ncbi:hypothetical protein C8N35_104274 [Breoghania corrubedonensis]|uniref:Uncharacterized protein n=1 Tax=Breoghania corrubedonensis TaxID=665038 RepID=A0A2T5VA66_9HYPH|nr:hypothetical protein [Breoghania corrubedonensis]PTW60648.1 hypothetical protein C8N35_104274 [Breoghania corrubedonensis]
MNTTVEHGTGNPGHTGTAPRDVRERRSMGLVRVENLACAETKARVARCAQAQANLDEALRETFPASDPVSVVEPAPGDVPD